MYTEPTILPVEDQNEMIDTSDITETNDAVAEDVSPVLDEQDLEQTGLNEEAEDVECEEPADENS